MTLGGKRALVTGGSRGIGAAIARDFAKNGCDVVITYERSVDLAEKVVADIAAGGRRAFALQSDSGDAESAGKAVDDAVRLLGGLDILVNNAGISRAGPLDSLTLADINDILNVNIRSVVLASQAALSHLSAGGRIINIGSAAGERTAFPGLTIYSMSKSALQGFTRGLVKELGPRGITVNVIQPGSTDTDMNPGEGDFAEQQRSLIPLGKFGTVQDIAATATFLAGPGGNHINGICLTVDGGANV